MSFRQLFAVTLFAVTSAVTATAQSAADHIAQGDKAYAALNPQEALTHYEAAIKADPKNVDALVKAALTAAAIGEFSDSARNGLGEYIDSTRMRLFNNAQAYAERAVALDSFNTTARFALAYAAGRAALAEQLLARLPYVTTVYQQSRFCLRLNPKSAECSHVYGALIAEMMRLDQMRSMMVYMAHVPQTEVSWVRAEQYLKQATNIQPNRIIHHYDLGRIYADMDDKDKAKAEFETVLKLPDAEYNDKFYKMAAQQALKTLGS